MCAAIVLSLISIGCSRFTSEGETLIRGTATINGKEYVDITKRYWNTGFHSAYQQRRPEAYRLTTLIE